MPDNSQEKRREPRHPAKGRLVITSTDAAPASRIEGELMDISVHGFRASHSGAGLSTGEVVHFEHAHGRGRARVVWNRIQGHEAQSGFIVIDD